MFPTHVQMQIEWFVPLGQIRSIAMALHSVAAETRGTRGCVGCAVSTDISNRGVVTYKEEWLTEDDLRQRMQSETFNTLVTLLEDATQPPHVEFTLGHATRGFDFVEEVRASAPRRWPR